MRSAQRGAFDLKNFLSRSENVAIFISKNQNISFGGFFDMLLTDIPTSEKYFFYSLEMYSQEKCPGQRF